ncbi:MAG: BtpA/SgcQ family protein [Oligoflexia bacterium]|nr:BtpA/SgcQ family protein [Oligoflexia bacterium]
MARKRFPSLIGVIHLPPLAGAPKGEGTPPSELLQTAGLQAVKEAQLLSRAGFEGLILENFGDVPFYKNRVPPETIASMAVIAAAVRESTRIPIGLNVLRNDGPSALAIASVTGCDFVRINVLSGVAAADQGLLEGEAAFLLRERQRLGSGIMILADVHVKHARMLSSTDLTQAVEDAASRALADGVIVSGSGTGKPVDLLALQQASLAVKSRGIPLFVGSGATAETLRDIRKLGAGVIVSSALRRGGKAGAPLDPRRIREFVKVYRSARR